MFPSPYCLLYSVVSKSEAVKEGDDELPPPPPPPPPPANPTPAMPATQPVVGVVDFVFVVFLSFATIFSDFGVILSRARLTP